MIKRILMGLASCIPSVLFGAGVLEVRAPGYDFRSAEYTTSHVFIDEIAGTTADIEIRFDLTAYSNVTDVEVFSNLNRRDLARIDKNSDGYADGIEPVNGSLTTDSPADTNPVTGHYYIPVNMTDGDNNGIYELTIPASKTGAYRLTARFKKSGDTEWTWYGLRDHAIVVSPIDARDIRLYEINVFNIDASGDTLAQRSTLEDLHDAPGAAQGGSGNWNLDYLKSLGMNWLWFQPIHPNGIAGREIDAGTSSPYEPGSPYAVKNFFEVNELMTINYNGSNSIAQNRTAAMTAWSNFVASSDFEDVGIMLDAPFNHTAFDVELGQQGVDIWSGGASWSATDEIRIRERRVFSREDDYYQRAGLGAGEGIAPAPDRYDFGKWLDVKDIYFGRYASLWRDSGSTNKQKDEGDWFDYSSYAFNGTDGGSFDGVTQGVWDYFAEYAIYWLEQTRPSGQNRNSIPADGDAATRYAWDQKGIDGLRCDFGQGLPPRCWEYIINVARGHKWNFVMMSESLDGGEVTYRSNRHFDILNESILFALPGATDYTAYRNIFEERRTAYGQGLVLLNSTSHDEQSFADPWEAVIRSAACGMIGGATMIFPGQELGISTTYGYDQYETNFGKQVPHFKRWNSMAPIWADSNYGNDQLFNVYSGIQKARASSPALQSSNRWFLDGVTNNSKIFATAKYEEANASPTTNDVVLGFVNLDRNNDQSDSFKIPAGLDTLIGLDDARLYNIVNIAAYERPPAITGRRNSFLWGSPKSGAELKTTGFSVTLYKVPIGNSHWDAIPYEAQYLKLVDVTDPLEVAINSIGMSGTNNVVVSCAAEPGRYYHLEARTNLLAGSWTTVLPNEKADSSTITLTHAGGTVPDEQFYRVRASYVEL
jgi:hypothetical protein